jgi:hypothetical protein
MGGKDVGLVRIEADRDLTDDPPVPGQQDHLPIVVSRLA